MKLPITMRIFLGKRLCSVDLQFYTYRTSNTAISWVKEQFKNRFLRNFAHPVIGFIQVSFTAPQTVTNQMTCFSVEFLRENCSLLLD